MQRSIQILFSLWLLLFSTSCGDTFGGSVNNDRYATLTGVILKAVKLPPGAGNDIEILLKAPLTSNYKGQEFHVSADASGRYTATVYLGNLPPESDIGLGKTVHSASFDVFVNVNGMWWNATTNKQDGIAIRHEVRLTVANVTDLGNLVLTFPRHNVYDDDDENDEWYSNNPYYPFNNN